MNEMAQISPEMTRDILFFTALIFLFIVAFSYCVMRFLRFLEIKLKVRKIKKLSKKNDLENFVLKTDTKGIPTMLIHRNDPTKIFIL